MSRAKIRDLPCEITVSEPEPDELFGGTFREITVELARQAWTTRVPEAELSEALEAAYHVRGALNRHEDERQHRENRAALLEGPCLCGHPRAEHDLGEHGQCGHHVCACTAFQEGP